MATKYGFRSSTFVILSKFYFFPPFHVNFCLHFGTLCRIPSFIAHARKSKFFSSRVEKKVAAPKFGDVFIGANGEKQSKAAGELADPCDPFSSIPPPPPSRATESPAAAEGEFMSREDLKKKHEFNEKEQVEPFLATYLDVAVLRCLFTSQWIEEGIEWALHFLFRRLEAISKYREKRRETLFRSSSLPTPKRKSGERNQTESKSCRPKNTDSNNEASIGANGENTQLKTGASGFQESRRSSFSGLPGMSALHLIPLNIFLNVYISYFLQDYRDFKLSSAVLQVPHLAAMVARKQNIKSKRKAILQASRCRQIVVNNAQSRTLPADITNNSSRNLAVNTVSKEKRARAEKESQRRTNHQSLPAINNKNRTSQMKETAMNNDPIRRQSLKHCTTLRIERFHFRIIQS